MIRSREEILADIRADPRLCERFFRWEPKIRQNFLDCCSGCRGMKVLYDGIFKEIFNPEQTPGRLEALLSLIIGREVKIEQVLPNDSVRLGAETSLIYTDIMVKLEDGSLSDIEIQKIGYDFPGQRCACYAADHLLRQYKRIRNKKQKGFRYQDVKTVYTIVFFEKSTTEFKHFPDQWIHSFRQCSNTGLVIDFLQEFHLIALDIFKKNLQNKCIETDLDAWLAFLSFDSPKRILELSSYDPVFKAMYLDIYELMLNTEKVMDMYSKDLAEMDRNTVLFMIDRMQAETEQLSAQLKEMTTQREQLTAQLEQTSAQLEQTSAQLEQQILQNKRLQAQLFQQ